MGTEKSAHENDLPADPHLRDDVEGPETGPGSEDFPGHRFLPGQTNAGQQVGGLASGSLYGEDDDPDAQPDTNNPI